MLLVSALAVLFATRRAGLACAGPFSALAMGLIAEMRWKKETYLNENEVALLLASHQSLSNKILCFKL